MVGKRCVVLLMLTAAQAGMAVPINLSNLSVPYTQDFNSLASTGPDNTSLPIGWVIAESGANANGMYRAGTGSSTTGDTYSFGNAGNAERALGGLRSSNLIPLFGAEFRNDTEAVIIALQIEYWGEQWRLGTSGRADRLDFQYSLDATSLTSGTWVDVGPLDFQSPETTGDVGARDGNSSSNRASRTVTISGLSISAGSTFWLRWVDFDASGADDGLAVDDFKLTALGATVSHTVPDGGATLPLGLIGLAAWGLWVRGKRVGPGLKSEGRRPK